MGFVLAYAIDSSILISAAYWVTIATLVLAVLLITGVVLMRVLWINQQRRRRKITRQWSVVFDRSFAGEPVESLPPVRKFDRIYFLEYWNSLHETVPPEKQAILNDIARRVKIERTARKLATDGLLWKQLLGLQTLGHMRSDSADGILRKDLHSDDSIVSITAARAYMQIAPHEALQEIVPMLSKRRDWGETRIAEMLRYAAEDEGPVAVREALKQAPLKTQPRLVRLLGSTGSPVAHETVRQLLVNYSAHKEEPEYMDVVVAGLRTLNSPEDRDAAHRYLVHHNWRVRMEAAMALGRIGSAEDEKRLAMLLHDEHWWVRFRAAQAISKLPNTTTDGLFQLLAKSHDSPAEDIMRHIVAERELTSRGTITV